MTYTQYLQRAEVARSHGDAVTCFEEARQGLQLVLSQTELGKLKLNTVAAEVAALIQPQSKDIADQESISSVFAIREDILTRVTRLEFDHSTITPSDFAAIRKQLAVSSLKFAVEILAAMDPRAIAKADVEKKEAEEGLRALLGEIRKEMWKGDEPDFNYKNFKNETLKEAMKRLVVARNTRIYVESFQQDARKSWPQFSAMVGRWLAKLYAQAPADSVEHETLLQVHGLEKSAVADAVRGK